MYTDDVSEHVFFFFQAEDGIRDLTVTGVQTCALPISADPVGRGTAARLPAPVADCPFIGCREAARGVGGQREARAAPLPRTLRGVGSRGHSAAGRSTRPSRAPPRRPPRLGSPPRRPPAPTPAPR